MSSKVKQYLICDFFVHTHNRSCLCGFLGGCQIWCNPCLNFFQKVQFFRGSVVTGWTGYDVVQLHIGLVRDGIVFFIDGLQGSFVGIGVSCMGV